MKIEAYSTMAQKYYGEHFEGLVGFKFKQN